MRRLGSLGAFALLRRHCSSAPTGPSKRALLSPALDSASSALGGPDRARPQVSAPEVSSPSRAPPDPRPVAPGRSAARDDLDRSCRDGEGDEEEDEEGDGASDCEADFRERKVVSEALARDAKSIVDVLRETASRRVETKPRLDKCGVAASSELVTEVLSQVRNDWESAFTFFLWAGNQRDYSHSVREYHSMISILAKMKKFDTAWALIDEMRGGKDRPCLLTPQTLLIMIRRYCAVHNVGKAINTFYAHRRYNFDVGIEEFQGLLSALCRYKNVRDAEHLLFCNKSVFPLNTKSLNIILNGWCNVIVSPRQGERIWKEMSKRGIAHDVVSYACLISCYSKSRNLNMVLKLFNRMKELEIAPDRKVYNAVIHALAKGRLVKEAVNLMRMMDDKGIAPNAVTYNSLIMPLCKARNVDGAKKVFDEMLQQRLHPTIRTYNAFLRILRTGEEVFELLTKMKEMGCHPTYDTYIMLIRKFCRWRQLDNVFELWNAMTENGLSPDRSSYIVLIHGLFLNGKLEEAYRYYLEMKNKLFLPEPKIDEMLQAWVSGKQVTAISTVENQPHFNHLDQASSGKLNRESDFLRQPESRTVVRERGYSFWEH
ncbi:pentatricopeptide repeat-containing protein At5g15010, mitochondrial [Eucalyptus grandis]|nr:pentatricopeptide repeat-containing protein At5g15010, mitochondrial [Eucalyptus grandis]XP_039159238.1 pentatricopeptide repeat-containing protein At5g15010, mitochondrial [Eucalyptus grandis]